MNFPTRKQFEDPHPSNTHASRIGGAHIAAFLLALPAISLAQRWDNIAAFPLPTSFNSNPNAITTGPDGNLWFTDGYQEVVGNITMAGVVTEYFVCCGPQGITSGPDG